VFLKLKYLLILMKMVS